MLLPGKAPGCCHRWPGQLTYNHMVVKGYEQTSSDRVFHALADPTRRDIVRRSLREAESVSALARRYPMSVTAVQKHVAVLEAAGLVRKQRQGREQLVHGEIATVQRARLLLADWETVWRGRIDRFGEVLATVTEGET